MIKNVLIIGGTGFIGSHTAVQLLESGYNVSIIDNLSNSDVSVVSKITQITNKSLEFRKVDTLDYNKLSTAIEELQPEAIINFSAKKAVGESIKIPLDYYENNICGLINILKCMKNQKIHKLIFSSSATVYGIPKTLPITEDSPLMAINPYGRTKLMAEEILTDLAISDPKWQITLLRYFNPIGAHPSGLIGESPNGIPNNLFPYIIKVAKGELQKLQIFGDDYPTKDGTGVRDYIHVMDLADGHISALNHNPTPGQCDIYNLGTGAGISVLELVEEFQRVTGQKIAYEIIARRPGDSAEAYADATKANNQLNWKARRNLSNMISDGWNYATKS